MAICEMENPLLPVNHYILHIPAHHACQSRLEPFDTISLRPSQLRASITATSSRRRQDAVPITVAVLPGSTGLDSIDTEKK